MDTSRGNRMLKELLGVEHAIIQAPMAGGVTTEELVSAVSRAGGLGMIGAGGMDPEALRKTIHELKKRNDGAFGANLFVPWNFKVTEENIAGAYEKLRPVYDHFGLEQETFIPPDMKDIKVKFDAQLDVIVEEKVPVCSFIFGIPENRHIERLKEAGTILLGTATTVEEAEAIERPDSMLLCFRGQKRAATGGHSSTLWMTASWVS